MDNHGATETSLRKRIKSVVLGDALSPSDKSVFHKLSLIAFFAWVGLGADGLSSSCYGPEEAFLALGTHPYLSIFVALATAITVFVISASYIQIIELFPSGGGGYLVASKMLSPKVGMISGCALLIDYVLTITISVASGADALFSFLPESWAGFRFGFALVGMLGLTLLNMRGVKESILPLVPVFLIFLITHAIAITLGIFSHAGNFGAVAATTAEQWTAARSELGLAGALLLLLSAYSHGAGTYTGIEAVSNGMPLLREPRVQTGKRTMHYMAISLALTAMGLMFAYLLLNVSHQPNKTLNAVMFETVAAGWGNGGRWFIGTALVSEALLLFVAAQAGFLGGPRALANMALDRWMPTKFATLSDRLVTQNGVLLMGAAAVLMLLLAEAAVKVLHVRGIVPFLVVLYSINVFITFSLSQAGMVRHWWQERRTNPLWRRKLAVAGSALCLTGGILVSVTVMKFFEGGWITILLTGLLVTAAYCIRRHYNYTRSLLKRLDDLVEAIRTRADAKPVAPVARDPKGKTAVILVSGFNGLGLHTLLGVLRVFAGHFKNFVFVEVGVVDAGNFKGAAEVENLRTHCVEELQRYVTHMQSSGYYAECFHAVGTDVVEELSQLAPRITEKFPNAVFFGGQLVFPKDTFASRWLHNYTVFEIQRRFYRQGIPFVLLPIRV